MDTESSSADYTSEYEDQMLPPVAEYLSMVGEAHILAERLSDLKTEYLVLVDQHEKPCRQQRGYCLDDG